MIRKDSQDGSDADHVQHYNIFLSSSRIRIVFSCMLHHLLGIMYPYTFLFSAHIDPSDLNTSSMHFWLYFGRLGVTNKMGFIIKWEQNKINWQIIGVCYSTPLWYSEYLIQPISLVIFLPAAQKAPPKRSHQRLPGGLQGVQLWRELPVQCDQCGDHRGQCREPGVG